MLAATPLSLAISWIFVAIGVICVLAMLFMLIRSNRQVSRLRSRSRSGHSSRFSSNSVHSMTIGHDGSGCDNDGGGGYVAGGDCN